MNAKVENYTAEAVETLAAKVGKSVRSVVAKLAREGVYVAKSRTDVTKVVTKASLVAKIADKVGTTHEKLASLEKATKEALEILAG